MCASELRVVSVQSPCHSGFFASQYERIEIGHASLKLFHGNGACALHPAHFTLTRRNARDPAFDATL